MFGGCSRCLRPLKMDLVRRQCQTSGATTWHGNESSLCYWPQYDHHILFLRILTSGYVPTASLMSRAMVSNLKLVIRTYHRALWRQSPPKEVLTHPPPTPHEWDERLCADDIFKRIFMNENFYISIQISLMFVPNGSIDNLAALVQVMAWHRTGDKPLSEPTLT